MFNSIISPENKAILIGNAKSYAWRVALIAAVTGLDFASANLHLFSLPSSATVLFGLFLGEAHDFLNQKYSVDSQMATAVLKVLPSKRG